jgi:hypothetical protein
MRSASRLRIKVLGAIIRYAHRSGESPADDATAFDGWYYRRDLALTVTEDWDMIMMGPSHDK